MWETKEKGLIVDYYMTYSIEYLPRNTKSTGKHYWCVFTLYKQEVTHNIFPLYTYFLVVLTFQATVMWGFHRARPPAVTCSRLRGLIVQSGLVGSV